eukprot:2906350-Rhodomonas_salina.1
MGCAAARPDAVWTRRRRQGGGAQRGGQQLRDGGGGGRGLGSCARGAEVGWDGWAYVSGRSVAADPTCDAGHSSAGQRVRGGEVSGARGGEGDANDEQERRVLRGGGRGG